jgi:hypothetical protein
MNNTFLIITTIASDDHPILRRISEESVAHGVSFITIGDTKSPTDFNLKGCDFYSVERQHSLNFKLAEFLPYKHYSRKNLGYLIAMSKGAEIIIETDDDNLPDPEFWRKRSKKVNAHLLTEKGWINVYKYFTDLHIWPRGFPLENIADELPALGNNSLIECPIQQGLANKNPDVDAIYRLTLPLPVVFNEAENIALGSNTICPFNSQNTTWFRESFPLLYLPSYCTFRMTDIWRSFVAQRIAWSCKWPILFHSATVVQERNEHNILSDFNDEIPGYLNNSKIVNALNVLDLKTGIEKIPENMIRCYEKLIEMTLVGEDEIDLLRMWLADYSATKNKIV